jgi:serine/threonine-protein kinase
MAPEQWADSSKVTSAADVYSLGCVLFEMGCGRPPFCAATMAEACTSHLHERAPSMRSIYPDTPPALDAFVQRLLAKAPRERPAMTAIATELFALGGDVLPLAPTIGAWNRPAGEAAPTTLDIGTGELHRRTRVRRTIAGSLAGVLLVAALAIVTAIGGSESGEPVARPAATPTIRAAPVLPPARPVPREPTPRIPTELAATVSAPVTPKPPARRTKPIAPTPPTPTPIPPSPSRFEGIELDRDGIPTKR